MHGKSSEIALDILCPIFAGLPARIQGARYHSLAALEHTLPPGLIITARADDGEIMAVRRRDTAVYGLQFHPESVLTPDGSVIIRNFMREREQ
jgi:anthranilate synthase component 2